MAFKPFKQIRLSGTQPPSAQQINDLQYNIGVAIAQLLGKDQLDSIVVKNITLLPGVMNKIGHNLGRPINGYIPIRTHKGYAILTDFQDSNPSPNLLLYLQVPAECIVDLLVF